ncbi:MAG: hypothetical protein HY731_10670 [Candidatus Tectomicrobia bacterium]|nr:hypothetical protein [Candidatus Tectomicrobia bacterium]
MKRIGVILLLSLFLPIFEASSENRAADAIKYEAEFALKKIVSLWKDEKYAQLYQYGTLDSQAEISIEEFAEFMVSEKEWTLQCCWATIQNIESVYKSDEGVYVRAKIGYEPKSKGAAGQDRFIHETFKMVYEDRQWRLDLVKILDSVDGAFTKQKNTVTVVIFGLIERIPRFELSRGGFQLIDKGRPTFLLTSKKVNLDRFVGRRVTLRGFVVSEKKRSGPKLLEVLSVE